MNEEGIIASLGEREKAALAIIGAEHESISGGRLAIELSAKLGPVTPHNAAYTTG